jgi:hypothetical protein
VLDDQLRYRRQIHAADPIIAPEPNNPSTARPRFGDATGVGVGDGVSVGKGVTVGAVVPGANVDGVSVGVAVCSGVRVGRGVSVGSEVGSGVGVRQKSPMQDVGVGDGISVGVGDGVGVPGGVGICANAINGHDAAATIAKAKPKRRFIYISTTRCVSVDLTPARLWICSSTTSAR